MSRLWNWCAFCGKRIETGEKCYGLPNGESVCTDCCVEENEGAAVSEGEWDSITEAAKDVGCSTREISGALKGKRKTVKGLIWNYRTNCGAKLVGGED